MFKLLVIFSLLMPSFAFSQEAEPAAEVKSHFRHESEASLVQVTGNTETESYSAKQKTTYAFDLNSFTLTGSYLRTKSFAVETARSWDLSLRYEREISSMWSAFVQQGAESDIYSGYIQRDNSDIGAKYFIIKSEPQNFFAELGYRYIKTYTNAGVSNYSNSGRLYVEYSQVFNETVKGQLWVEYLPNFKESDQYQFNYEPSVSVMLSKIFSLKLSRLVKYQNVPPAGANKKEDARFTTSLVAQF